jgi:hypothetical protein
MDEANLGINLAPAAFRAASGARLAPATTGAISAQAAEDAMTFTSWPVPDLSG